MTQFHKLAEREVFRGSLISVAEATFAGPSGDTFERDVVHHPGAVVVVPLFDDGTVVMVRQYRAALDRMLLEIPAGKRDVDGEPVEVTARRELEEEVGLRAGRLDKLAEFYNSPGFCDELAFLFLARDLTDCGRSVQGEEEEHMTVERVALADLGDLVASGELTDGKSIIGLSLTAALLAREAAGGS